MLEEVDIKYRDENQPLTVEEAAIAQVMHIARTIYLDALQIHYSLKNAEVMWGDDQDGKPAFGFTFEDTDDNNAAFLHFISDVYKINGLEVSPNDENLGLLSFENLENVVEHIDKLLIRINAKFNPHRAHIAETDIEKKELLSLKEDFYSSRESTEDAAILNVTNDNVDLLFTFGLNHLKKALCYLERVQNGALSKHRTSDGFHIH